MFKWRPAQSQTPTKSWRGERLPVNNNLKLEIMEFTVIFSNLNEDFNKYQTKIRRSSEDEVTGIESQVTYYFWGNKEHQGTLELNIDDYIVVAKEVEIDGKLMTLKQIVGRK
jgi:hypothetical protein